MSDYRLRFLASAQQDLNELLVFLTARESQARAREILQHIRELCSDLETMPQRGHVPPELEGLGSRKFLEIHFKPYRIIYQVCGRKVYIHMVCDGRRDMQALLKRRLLSTNRG